MQLLGIHHLTAVSARIGDNHDFYTRVLGLRLVKKTVNQDDVRAYHLFYADGKASPGTDITFFDWPVPPERRGTRSIVRTAFRLHGAESFAYWAARLAEHGVTHTPAAERDGRLTLDFEDPEGQRLCFVEDGGVGEVHPWEKSPVPAEHQIRGLGPITLSVPVLQPTEAVLLGVLNLRKDRSYEIEGKPVQVYAMGGGGAAAELHVLVDAGATPARPGAGSVHHVALRTPNDEEYAAWNQRLQDLKIPSSGPVNRFYFRSLYFREPNGILFEIATDGPGFAADESADALGETLALPPFLEPRRAEIEAGLKPIKAGV